jgi:hypothetical protein
VIGEATERLQALGQQRRCRCPRDEDGELVAAEPGDQVAPVARPSAALGDDAEHLVPGLVSVGVVAPA